MEKKMKLTELADYYIERYNIRLKEENRGVKVDNLEDNLYQQIKRQLQRARVNNVSLYDTLKSKGQSGPRKISINEYEDYCFDDLYKYITTKLTDYDYNEDILNRDNKEHITDEAYQAEMNIFTSTDPDELMRQNEELQYETGYTYEQKEQTKYKMMISAIYDIFYDDFKWQELQDDMDAEQDYDMNNLRDERTAKAMEARDRLKNYKNYVGERKNSHLR